MINSREEGKLFSLDYDPEYPPSVISTVYFLSHFQDAILMIHENYLISDLILALLPYQNQDGSWSECSEMLEWDKLPEWADTKEEASKIWVSALATTVLSTLPSSFVSISVIKKGIDYLKKHVDEENGGIKDMIHATFVASPLIYSRMLGNRDFVEKTNKLITQTIVDNDFGGTLGWYQEQLSNVTTPKIRSAFVELFKKIKYLQLDDGSFMSEEGDDEKFRAQATVQALIGYLKAEERIKTFQKPKFSSTMSRK